MNAVKRLVVYDDSYAFGGHELMLCRLLRHLRASPEFMILALFSYENRRYFQEQGFTEGTEGSLEIRYLPFSNPRRLGNIAALFSFRRILEIATMFRRFRPDAVLVAQGGIDTCTLGTLAARLCRFRTLSYIPNLNGYARTHPSAKNRLRDLINGLFYRLPREYAVVRQGQEAELRAHGFKGPVHVIYNGMDFRHLRKLERAAARKELGLPEDGYWIGMVGRIDLDNKGQDLLLKAMATHPASFEGARLLFVGDGPDLERLESHIESAGLRDRCAILPFRKELSAVYSSLDLLAIPSKSEGMPLVMIEAMIMEIPVIASAIDGMLEMLPTDWLFPSGDAAGLAQRVAELRSRLQADRVEDHRRVAATRFAEDRFLESFRQFLK